MKLSHEQRQFLKAEIDRVKRSKAVTFEGVCMDCLGPIPEERLEFGALYCSDTHRKRAADRIRKEKLKRARQNQPPKRAKYELTEKRQENADAWKRTMVFKEPE